MRQADGGGPYLSNWFLPTEQRKLFWRVGREEFIRLVREEFSKLSVREAAMIADRLAGTEDVAKRDADLIKCRNLGDSWRKLADAFGISAGRCKDICERDERARQRLTRMGRPE